jgi:hypothetical protein
MGGFSKEFEHLANSEDADSLNYLTSVRQLHAVLKLAAIHVERQGAGAPLARPPKVLRLGAQRRWQ